MNIINISRNESKTYIDLNKDRIDKKKNKLKDDLKALDSDNRVQEDQVTISKEAKEAVEEERNLLLEDMEEKLYLIENFKEDMKASNDEENPYEMELKCLLISLRIINGDEVPPKDKNFLMEHKPEMYGNAILLRRVNDEPKKHKSLLEDDKDGEELEDLSIETQDLIAELSPKNPIDESQTPED